MKPTPPTTKSERPVPAPSPPGAAVHPTQRELHRLIHVLSRERSRIDRAGGVLSLVVFSLPGGVWLKRPRMRRLIAVLGRRLRITDEVGVIDGRRAFALLPDTDAMGAEVLARQVQRRVAEEGFTLSFAVFRYVSGKARRSVIAHDPHDHDRHDGDGNASVNDHAFPLHTNGSNGHTLSNGHANGHGNGHANPDNPIRVALATLEPEPAPAEPEPSLIAHFACRLPCWKRGIDLTVASVALLITSPILLATAAAIKLESPGPVLFTQLRRGAGRRPFRIYKFRTMDDGAEARRQELSSHSEQDGPAFKMRNDPRITRVGRFLRNSSIDELPQLLNVLKGDMTLVGPRPLPVPEADGCAEWRDARHSVHPGLTCVWQVRGRSRVSFDEWARMDLDYIHHRGLWQDLKILLATVPAVVRRDGAC